MGAGRHEGERKESSKKVVRILRPTVGGQDPAKNTFDTAWMIHSHFKHIRNEGRIETKCSGRKCNSIEMEWELGLGCAAGSGELLGLQEAILGPLTLLEGISSWGVNGKKQQFCLCV